MQRSRPTIVSNLPSAHFVSPPSAPYPSPHVSGSFAIPPTSSPPNAGVLRARSTDLLHFISSHPVCLICIQESNFSSSSSFRIPEFSALRSNRTHSRSGILPPDDLDASGGVSLHSGGLKLTYPPSGTQKTFLIPVGKKYSIGSFSLTFLSMTLTRQLFSVAPLLTSLLSPSLLPILAPGKCCRIWVPITYQFY